MKRFVFIIALMSFSWASADVNPGTIVGGIFDFIQDQINDDHDADFIFGKGVLLKDLGDRIALGRIQLTNTGSVDSFVLPPCANSANQLVSALRFRVSGEDAFVTRVIITYQNGQVEAVDVNDSYQQNTSSDWYVVGKMGRCVKSIAVIGNSISKGFGHGTGHGFQLGGVVHAPEMQLPNHPAPTLPTAPQFPTINPGVPIGTAPGFPGVFPGNPGSGPGHGGGHGPGGGFPGGGPGHGGGHGPGGGFPGGGPGHGGGHGPGGGFPGGGPGHGGGHGGGHGPGGGPGHGGGHGPGGGFPGGGPGPGFPPPPVFAKPTVLTFIGYKALKHNGF